MTLVCHLLCDFQDEKILREALDFANACGAATVTGKGAIPSLPTKSSVLRVMFTLLKT
jgi:fructokinase